MLDALPARVTLLAKTITPVVMGVVEAAIRACPVIWDKPDDIVKVEMAVAVPVELSRTGTNVGDAEEAGSRAGCST